MPSHLEQIAVAVAERFSVDRVLDAGDLATVLRAKRVSDGHSVALKVLTASLGPDARRRFLREAGLAMALRHPNIVPIDECGELGGLTYAAMPLVEAESLRTRSASGRPLSVEEGLTVARDVAAALAYAHGQGILHRELQPEHILLTDGHAVVTGFGMAGSLLTEGERLTRDGFATRDLEYMSPDQRAGRPPAQRDDVYALARTVHDVLGEGLAVGAGIAKSLTGGGLRARYRLPAASRRTKGPLRALLDWFRGGGGARSAGPQFQVRPSAAAGPGDLADAVMRALLSVPDERYPTAMQFLESCIAMVNALGADASAAVPPNDVDPERHLRAALRGRYEIRNLLGAGGMALVFAAHDVKHDRAVAVKVLRPELAPASTGSRFLQEIRIAAQLNHPHILPLLDSGEAGGRYYYVTPLAEGDTLRHLLKLERRLPLESALAVTAQVAAALDYAHARGIVHRDIKPENVLLHAGQPIIADFGVALALSTPHEDRITQLNMAIGTPQYMSPEQLEARRDLDGRTDLYSLGCVLFEMLTGAPPYDAPTFHGVMAQHLAEAVPHVRERRDDVPARVDEALSRVLAKRREDRFQDGASFVRALTVEEPR